MTSLLAVLVLILTLPGPVSWTCMLESGAVRCCCVGVDDGAPSDVASGCCPSGRVPLAVGQPGGDDPQGGGEPDGEPCGCGGDGQEQLPVVPKDGGESLLAAWSPPVEIGFGWPAIARQRVGAIHERQVRCTGPPLYVLYETFLI